MANQPDPAHALGRLQQAHRAYGSVGRRTWMSAQDRAEAKDALKSAIAEAKRAAALLDKQGVGAEQRYVRDQLTIHLTLAEHEVEERAAR
jgi:hypothetical protein